MAEINTLQQDLNTGRHTVMKVKNPDGSFTPILPINTLDDIISDNGTDRLSSVIQKDDEGYTFNGQAAAASSVHWNGVESTPTTVAGYGITDAVKTSEVTTTAEANKILKLNSEGKIPTEAVPQSIKFVTYTSADITG